MKPLNPQFKLILDSKPFFNWPYGLGRESDILIVGTVCSKLVPGTDLNHKNGVNP
jgi:hypothetical protein